MSKMDFAKKVLKNIEKIAVGNTWSQIPIK
jgi:hypothetical protein